MVQFSILHPICLWFIQSQILTYTAAHTSKNSVWRLVGFLAAIPFSILGIANFRTFVTSTGYAARGLCNCFTGGLVTWLDRFLLRKWSFEDDFTILGGEKKESRRSEWAKEAQANSRYW